MSSYDLEPYGAVKKNKKEISFAVEAIQSDHKSIDQQELKD